MIKISIDVMGAELGPQVVLKGSLAFFKQHKDAFFVFVGNETKIKIILDKISFPKENYKILNTTQVIEKNDNLMSIRRKKDSSMV